MSVGRVTEVAVAVGCPSHGAMSCPEHEREAGHEAHQEGARVGPQQRALAVTEQLREPASGLGAGSRRRLPRHGVVRRLRRDPVGLFEELKREQGDVARVRFGRSDFFLVSRPDLIKRIVASHARDYVREGFAYKSWRRAPQFAPPRGLLQPSADHDVHLRARRALQPVFRRRRVDAHWPDLLRMAEDGIGGWYDGETVDAVAEARRLVLPLVSSVHFTKELDLPMPELVAKLRAVADATVDATSWSPELRVRLLPRRLVEAAAALGALRGPRRGAGRSQRGHCGGRGVARRGEGRRNDEQHRARPHAAARVEAVQAALARPGAVDDGAGMTYVAVPYQVYRMTGSTLTVGLLYLCVLFPQLIVPLAGGAIADAVDRPAFPARDGDGARRRLRGLCAQRVVRRRTRCAAASAGSSSRRSPPPRRWANLEAGVVASLAGVRASIVSGGVGCVLGVAVLALALPRFRRHERAAAG